MTSTKLQISLFIFICSHSLKLLNLKKTIHSNKSWLFMHAILKILKCYLKLFTCRLKMLFRQQCCVMLSLMKVLHYFSSIHIHPLNKLFFSLFLTLSFTCLIGVNDWLLFILFQSLQTTNTHLNNEVKLLKSKEEKAIRLCRVNFLFLLYLLYIYEIFLQLSHLTMPITMFLALNLFP